MSGGGTNFMKYSYLDRRADDAYNEIAAESIAAFVDGVLRGENRDAELQEVYGLVYGIVLLDHPDRPYGLLARCLSSHLTRVGDELRRADDGPALLASTCRAWQHYCAAASGTVCNAFAYADAIARRRGSSGSRELALNSFRDMLTGRKYGSVAERLSAAIARSVDECRSSSSSSPSPGRPCPEATTCCRMMLALRTRGDNDSLPAGGRSSCAETNAGDCRTSGQSLFEKYLERRLTDELNRYLSGVKSARFTVAEYADAAAATIDAETDRARALFGDGPDGAHATAAVRHRATEQLVAWHRRYFVESETGLWAMIAAGRVDQAASVYRMLMRLDGGAAAVEDAVYWYARNRYYDPASVARRRFVADMIDWQATAARLLTDAFDDHPTVGRLIDKQLAYMLHNDCTFAECASLHVEDLATGGGGGGQDENGVFALIRRLNDAAKDELEVHYRNRLARRLLRLGYGGDRERDVVHSRLAESLGTRRTRKLRTMFADMDSSADLVAAFHRYERDGGARFDLLVLDVRAWPIAAEPARCSLPVALVDLFTRFRQFDCAAYGDNRKIVLMPQLSTADVIVGGGARVVRVSLFSAVVLSLFNGRRGALSYRDVSAASSIAPLQLKATLAALVHRRLLTREPRPGCHAVGPDDYVFRATDCRGPGSDDDAEAVVLDDVAW